MDAVTVVPVPLNEKVNDYAVGSPERARLETKLRELVDHPTEIRQVIGGVHRQRRRHPSRTSSSRTGTPR